MIASRIESPNDIDEDADNFAFKRAGIFTLISSKKIEEKDVMESYYTRQSIEQVFGKSGFTSDWMS